MNKAAQTKMPSKWARPPRRKPSSAPAKGATIVKKKKTKGTKIRKKAPGAPRRFKTAFIFFSIAKHKEIREELEKQEAPKQTTTAIAKMVSEAWKNLPKDERAVWDEIAAKDKARYDIEKRLYKGPWQVPNEGGRDPTAPRRPCSAFVSFLHVKRDEVKRANPDASSSEIMRIVAKTWHESPERSKFLEEEAKQLVKYKEDMTKWQDMQKRKPEAVLAVQREQMAWKALETPLACQQEEEYEYTGTAMQRTNTSVDDAVPDPPHPSCHEQDSATTHSNAASAPLSHEEEEKDSLEEEQNGRGSSVSVATSENERRNAPHGGRRNRQHQDVMNASPDLDSILSDTLASRAVRSPGHGILENERRRAQSLLLREELVRHLRRDRAAALLDPTLLDTPLLDAPLLGTSLLEDTSMLNPTNMELVRLLRRKREEHDILKSLLESQLASRLAMQQAGLFGGFSAADSLV